MPPLGNDVSPGARVPRDMQICLHGTLQQISQKVAWCRDYQPFYPVADGHGEWRRYS